MPDITLKQIADGGESPRLYAVFIHGLGGDPETTWRHASGFFWPHELAHGMKGLTTVYSVGYPCGKASWNSGWPVAQAAVAVLDRLISHRAFRVSNTPIVFICHSLGGLIVKKLILIAQSDRGQDSRKGIFLDRIAGVVFLATPHGGSFMATIASQCQWFVSDSMRDLTANHANLLDLSVSYRNCIADNGARIRHCVYYETQGVWGTKPVNAVSADPGITGVRPVPVGRDHIAICKVPSRIDEVYEGVLAFLEDEALAPRSPTQSEKIDELLEIARAGGVFQRAEHEGISEFAVRKIVLRLGGGGIAKADLLPWLDNWIEAAQRELGRHTNEDEAFEAARQEAERRFRAGHESPSSALMDEFAREEWVELGRQEERKRRRLRLLEEAIRFDELVLDADAATHEQQRSKGDPDGRRSAHICSRKRANIISAAIGKARIPRFSFL
jgi:hypothetical protein